MLIKLNRDTLVKLPKDFVIEVTDEEAKRLISLGNAEAEVKKEEPKKVTKTKKKKGE